MNERERIETDLLTIIREGQNLTDGYVEVRPGIRIKAGREREFTRLCDNYYEREFNQIIENDTDTITPVYDSLTKLIETETEDYYMSKATDFSIETKAEVEKFKNLVKSFNTVESAYRLTVRNLNDLYLKRQNTAEWQRRVDELNGEVKRLTENSTSLVEQINASRISVNNTLIKYAEEQMQDIRERFLRTSKDASQAPAMDHNVILSSDIEEYNSLYRLTLILKHANTIEDFTKLECLNDAMFITEDQSAVLNNTILPNIKFLNYARIDGKYIMANNDFIAKIQKAMERLEKSKGNFRTNNGIFLAKEAQEEYNVYLDMLKILHKANDNATNLEEVWGKVYVSIDDREAFINMLNTSKVFRTFNPDIERKEQNEKLIQELYSYLDELASTVTNYTGVANLPIKSTNAVGDKVWVVTENNFDEANRIIEIINLLLSQDKDLEPVWGIANINRADMPKFKNLVNATRKLGGNVPSIPENDAEIEKIRQTIKELFKRARDTENAVLNANGKVLDSDSELYKLLQDKYRYLEAAKASNNLVPIEGVLIDSNYSDKYYKVNAKIESLLNAQNVVREQKVIQEDDSSVIHLEEMPTSVSEEIDFSTNDRAIEACKKSLENLKKSKFDFGELGKEFLNIVNEMIELLTRAKISKNPCSFGGYYFANEEDKNRAIIVFSRHNELVEELNKMRRDAKNNTIEDNVVANDGYTPIPVDKSLEPIYDLGLSKKDNIIDFSANDNEIAELKTRLAELSAKSSHNELERNKFDLLSEQIEILEDAKKSENSIEIGGLRFAGEEDREKYADSLAKLNQINADLGLSNSGALSGDNSGVYASNDVKIAELKKEMASLESRIDADELAKKIYECLAKQVEVLENAKSSETIIDMQGLKFASEEDKEEFLHIQVNLDEILEELNANSNGKKKGKIRKKITTIRDYIGAKLFNNRIGNFISNHKALIKLLIGAGLGLAAITFVLPQIAPAIIFANSCNAAAIPALSGFLNSISSAIASIPFVNIPFTPGIGAINLGVNANLAGPALASALSKMGIIGLGSVLTFKGIKQYNNRDMEEHLKDPVVRSAIQKIADLIYELGKQWQKLMINIHLKEEEINNKISNAFSRKNREDKAQEQSDESVASSLDEQSVLNKSEITKEEKEAIGRKILEDSRKRIEQAQIARAQKMADEEGISFDEALKQIQDTAASSINFSKHPEASTLSTDDIPTLEEVERARELNVKEALEEQAKAQEGVPVIEIPNMGELINELDSSTLAQASEGEKMSPEEIASLMQQQENDTLASRIAQAMDGAMSTEEIDSAIIAKEQELRKFQDLLNITSSEELRRAYQNALDKANAEIDALKEQKGKGL